MHLDPRLLKTIDHLGFTQATNIQQLTIPVANQGCDLIASSKTGSGKTLAYLLPAINRCLSRKAFNRNDPRVLILTPTRELAAQVYAQVRLYLSNTHLKMTSIVGGDNFNDQVKALSRSPHVIVATPGRLADHLSQRSLYLHGLETFILDEADRMLDLGFESALRTIDKAADHKHRQTCMFSATLDHALVHELSLTLLNDPVRIHVGQSTEQHTDIHQRFFFANHLDHKIDLLKYHLKTNELKQVIIFTATREDTDKLADLLNQQHLKTMALSGKLPQQKRNQIMDDFNRNQYQVLVTTDVASRGLDIASVSHVINFDLPKHSEEYVHRIGRTGRAGHQGFAFSYVGPNDWQSFEKLRSFLQHELVFDEVSELPATFKGRKPLQKKVHVKKKITKTKANIKKKTAKKPVTAKKKKEQFLDAIDIGHQPVKKKK